MAGVSKLLYVLVIICIFIMIELLYLIVKLVYGIIFLFIRRLVVIFVVKFLL